MAGALHKVRKRFCVILCPPILTRHSWTNTPGSCAAPGRKNTRPSPLAPVSACADLGSPATQPAVRRWWKGVPMCRSLGLPSSERCQPSEVMSATSVSDCRIMSAHLRPWCQGEQQGSEGTCEESWGAALAGIVASAHCFLGKLRQTAGCAREEVQPARESWRLIRSSRLQMVMPSCAAVKDLNFEKEMIRRDQQRNCGAVTL